MITICVSAQKGGVGKTTTAEALILGLRNKGKRVLALDLDQSANLTKYFLGNNFENDIFDLLNGKKRYDEVVINDIIPGGNGLTYLPTFFERNDFHALKAVIDPHANEYDYFIIDTPPTTNKIVFNALAISDYVVIPSEPSNDCIDGCISTLQVVDLVKSNYNPKLKTLGVLLIKYKENYIAHSVVKSILFKNNIEVFNTVIRESQAINNAKLLNDNFFAKKYNSVKGVIDYHSFVREVLEKTK